MDDKLNVTSKGNPRCEVKMTKYYDTLSKDVSEICVFTMRIASGLGAYG